MEDEQANRRVSFGVFDLDLRTGELRKHGVRVRLQRQPFDVLAVLIQRAGDVVTREELQQKLWPANTFVDFEHGLNKAINKIRDALGDSADAPRFVETVARRGYRFLADVRVSAPASVPAPASMPAAAPVPGPTPAPGPTPVPAADPVPAAVSTPEERANAQQTEAPAAPVHPQRTGNRVVAASLLAVLAIVA